MNLPELFQRHHNTDKLMYLIILTGFHIEDDLGVPAGEYTIKDVVSLWGVEGEDYDDSPIGLDKKSRNYGRKFFEEILTSQVH